MATVPEVGSSSPAIRRRVVVLPQPDGPTRTSNSFSSTVKLAFCTARMLSPARPAKILVRFSMTTRATQAFLGLSREKSSLSQLGARHSALDSHGASLHHSLSKT